MVPDQNEPERSLGVGVASPDAADRAELASARGSISVLLVEDDEVLREIAAGAVASLGYALHVCGRGEDAETLLSRRDFDIAFLDVDLPHAAAVQRLRTAAAVAASTFIIVITGRTPEEKSTPPTDARAWGHLAKPYSARHVELLVERAARAVIGARSAKALHAHIRRTHGHSELVDLIGSSAAWRQVVDLAKRVAPTEAPVFISGESGCGKDRVAQFIHLQSRRREHQLVALNCAALPEALLESEMFGHRRGSFTGAVAEKPGLLEVAHRGTLFLDELTEMPATLQAKLLRVIQDGEVRRVGSTSTDSLVDIRYIASTNRSPQEAVEQGLLRRDLYYRLRVVPIRIPPLRERLEDIPVLATYFLEVFWSRHRRGELPMPVLGPEALASLQARPWPGNVRELQNTMEHAVVLLEPGQEIRPSDIPSLESEPTPGPGLRASPGTNGNGPTEAYHAAREKLLQEFERGYLGWLLEHARGNMSRAARIAGVDRTTLYRLLEKHGLQKDGAVTGGA